MEPKLSKSSTQTKILLFHFSSHKSLPEVCRSLHYLMKLNLIRLLFAVEIPENIFVGNSDFSLFCSVLATHASPLPDGRPASVKQSACWNRRYESYLSAMQQGGHMENLWKWHDSESCLKHWKYELQPENYLCPRLKVFHLLHWNSQSAYSSCLYTAEDNKGENKSINAKTSLNITIIRAAQALLMSRNERHKKTNLCRCNYKFLD